MQDEKKRIINCIKKELKNWNSQSEKYFNCTRKEMKYLLYAIRKGIYDNVFQKKTISLPLLSSWNHLRSERQKRKIYIQDITSENYEIYGEIKTTLHYITKLIEENNTITHQTPPTEQELLKILELYQKVTMTNYTKESKEEVINRLQKLNLRMNNNFPHNIKELEEAFLPQLRKHSEKYQNSPIITEIKQIQITVENTIKYLKNHDIKTIFNKSSNTKEENYIKRMILSQIDIPSVVFENFHIFLDQAMNRVRLDLKNEFVLTKESEELLWKESYTKREILLPLINGVLQSLEKKTVPLNIKQEIKQIQYNNHCSGEFVKTPYANKIIVSNSLILYSLSPEKIPIFLDNMQKKYDRLYYESSDYEFMEGCIEIMGDMMLSQIMVSGNKRTVKCLFNEMLISRNILPPIVDLNENEQFLWDKFVESRNTNYSLAKDIILQDTKEMAEQFNEDYYNKPLTIAKSATSRSDFSNKYYRR